MRYPRWRCGEPGCSKRRPQRVDTWGEFDDVDVALAELGAHYRRKHPDQLDDREGVGHALAA